MQFEDKKLRMLVLFEGESKLKFIKHEDLRYEYPQELIDFYERSTDFSFNDDNDDDDDDGYEDIDDDEESSFST